MFYFSYTYTYPNNNNYNNIKFFFILEREAKLKNSIGESRSDERKMEFVNYFQNKYKLDLHTMDSNLVNQIKKVESKYGQF